MKNYRIQEKSSQAWIVRTKENYALKIAEVSGSEWTQVKSLKLHLRIGTQLGTWNLKLYFVTPMLSDPVILPMSSGLMTPRILISVFSSPPTTKSNSESLPFSPLRP